MGKLRRTLSNLADTLTIVEENTQKILQITPELIVQVQTGSQHWRQVYAQWQWQLLKVKQILAIVSFVHWIWRGKFREQKKYQF